MSYLERGASKATSGDLTATSSTSLRRRERGDRAERRGRAVKT